MPQKPDTVYLVDGLRTPYLTSHDSTHTLSSADLLTSLSQQFLIRQPFLAGDLDAVFVASSTPVQFENLAYTLTKRLHSNASPYYFTANGPLTGNLALSEAIHKISHQQQQLILVGGVDTFPLPKRETTGLTTPNAMGDLLKKMHPVQSLVEQLTGDTKTADTNPALVEHAEKLAMQHLISPDQMSEYAQLSRRRLQYAQRNNLLKMITPLYYPNTNIQKSDHSVSAGLTQHHHKDGLQLLSDDALPVHANAACSALIASGSAVKHYNLPVLATLTAPTFSRTQNLPLENVDNTPNSAVAELLDSHQLSMNDIDYWEYHESSAADILVAKQCADKSTFSSMKNVNIDGGSLALGSAPCTNVFREIVQLAHILKRKKGTYGIATASSTDQHSFAVLLKASQENIHE
ncbi:MAG: Unknown protein [uncultured Thiotrichaceae bacterium]|uniref:Uncharacterized protein n=1 Tax=uncultured Thiotrichaceae bacterium TaxID=298394 RepID=A0A6S6UFV5_9GAMM|nr:MAG: Unknown protein [uncultured Thiotrichaceae bacterium]